MSALTDLEDDDLLTLRIRNGKEVIARFFGEDIGTQVFTNRSEAEALAMFTNRSEAEALAQRHGEEWEVCSTPSGKVFYVARKEKRAADQAA